MTTKLVLNFNYGYKRGLLIVITYTQYICINLSIPNLFIGTIYLFNPYLYLQKREIINKFEFNNCICWVKIIYLIIGY
jgi:hypothetical protein